MEKFKREVGEDGFSSSVTSKQKEKEKNIRWRKIAPSVGLVWVITYLISSWTSPSLGSSLSTKNLKKRVSLIKSKKPTNIFINFIIQLQKHVALYIDSQTQENSNKSN